MTRLRASNGTVAVVLCLGLAGCGASSSSPTGTLTPAPTPQPPELVRGVIAQTSFSNYFTGIWVGIELQVPNRGKVDITVDWTKDETWMFVYLGDKDCNFVQLEGGTCPFLITSETKEPKPRVLVSGIIEPGTYYLYLYNVPRVPGTDIGSDVTEAVSIQIGLTVGFPPP